MKMNKSKIIVSTLALAMGAALAGSVSGTVAWFQYSTRAQAAYIGTTAHCSEALEIQAVAVGGTADANKWKTELQAADVAAALVGETNTYGTNLTPITAGAVKATGALPTDMYANPIYQHFALDEWEKATVANYAQFELHFRVKDVNGSSSVSYLAKNVYLTDLSIVSLNADGNADVNADEDDTNDNDLYKAIRVHIAGANNKLFANDGGETNANVTTSTSSTLDLNNDGKLDTDAAYQWETAATPKAYGTDDEISDYDQVAYNIGKFNFTDDSDPTIPAANQKDGLIGATTKENVLKVTVTIWFEGWQKFAKPETGNYDEDPNDDDDTSDKQDSAVWKASEYIGKKFGVGFRFAVPAHTAADDE